MYTTSLQLQAVTSSVATYSHAAPSYTLFRSRAVSVRDCKSSSSKYTA